MRVNELASVLLVIGIIIAGLMAVGGFKGLRDPVQRCVAYQTWYQEWVQAGRPGGAAEHQRIERFYNVTRPICASRGVPI